MLLFLYALSFIILSGDFVVTEETCPVNVTLTTSTGPRNPRILSRRKRYLTFPQGSAFTATLQLLQSVQAEILSAWNLDFEMDVIWPIPSSSDLKPPLKERSSPSRLWHRRHKRDLYSNFELALNRQGLSGKDCILRTICEARSTLNPPGVSFFEDILRVVLTNLPHKMYPMDEYDLAYKMKKDCDSTYACPISLLELLLSYEDEY
ncbi:uncharacterized protein LOC107274851 [Cephus cinctus]|uniref:Uncharacterized protein LOC107274851 n=1 Tax=Cephus cinctus TaxID=211228 RepID=A0AAJ7FV50_CEPCN|nr:uncharacterized protein LOC107274851 [Cephus cinctus]